MAKRSSTFKRAIKQRLLRNGTRPCCFCRRTLTIHTATIEHVKPLSLGGGWAKNNLTLSCDACNQERGVEDFETFQRFKRRSHGEVIKPPWSVPAS